MNKKDFPIFENNPNLVYLDSAATSQRPMIVIESSNNFVQKNNANVKRGLYTLSQKALEEYNKARKTIADFIKAKTEETILTKNTTESINLLAYTLDSIIPPGKDEIILTEMEHHSNLVPWQEFTKRHKMKLKFIPLKDYELDYEAAKELITDKTAIVSITHASNVLGTINDVKTLINLAKEKGAISIVDAAQSITHLKIDVKDLDCDFLAFSSHKLLGPTGIGILYGKKDLLEKLRPFQFGGGMIEKVELETSTFAQIPEKFEAGTQNISETIAFAESINYIKNIGQENIEKHIKGLTEYALNKLKEIGGIKIYNPGHEKSIGLISFTINGTHPHDIASLLNDDNIAIRAGHHCAMPLMQILDTPGTARISFQIYNDKEDIEKLANSLKKAKEVLTK